MVRALAAKSGNTGRRTLVVMDAGIATSGNLMMLKQMGFDYLCVSRVRLKDYVISPDCGSVEVSDCRGHKITLRQVKQEEGGDPKENAQAERINGTIKNELLKGIELHSVAEARGAVAKAVDFYNNRRPHMSAGMMTPAQAAKCDGELHKLWHSYREEAIKN